MGNDTVQKTEAKEPIKTVENPAGTGRPPLSDEQYQIWIDDMRPFLRAGNTIWYAMEKTNLLKFKTDIYKKYKLGDWFAERIDALRATVGEMVNAVGFKAMEALHSRMVETEGKTSMTTEEVAVWKTMAEKHRTAQPFFVSRTETGESKPEELGKILDILGSDYDEFDNKAGSAAGSNGQAAEQTVATDAPVQNKE